MLELMWCRDHGGGEVHPAAHRQGGGGHHRRGRQAGKHQVKTTHSELYSLILLSPVSKFFVQMFGTCTECFRFIIHFSTVVRPLSCY
jgi:hypothetical protein